MTQPSGMYLLYSEDSEKRGETVLEGTTAAELFGNIKRYGGILRVPVIQKAGTLYMACSANGTAYGEEFSAGKSIYGAVLVACDACGDRYEDTLLAFGPVYTVPAAANAIVNVFINCR